MHRSPTQSSTNNFQTTNYFQPKSSANDDIQHSDKINFDAIGYKNTASRKRLGITSDPKQ